MPNLELETPEATYRNNMVRDCHFSIDCACGGKDGKYSGAHYKGTEGLFETIVDGYEPLRDNKFEHTFLLNEGLLLDELCDDYSEKNGQSPLVIVCNDCTREFPFTHESYLELRDKMIDEYNRRYEESTKSTQS